jgi:hypothetical protein
MPRIRRPGVDMYHLLYALVTNSLMAETRKWGATCTTLWRVWATSIEFRQCVEECARSECRRFDGADCPPYLRALGKYKATFLTTIVATAACRMGDGEVAICFFRFNHARLGLCGEVKDETDGFDTGLLRVSCMQCVSKKSIALGGGEWERISIWDMRLRVCTHRLTVREGLSEVLDMRMFNHRLVTGHIAGADFAGHLLSTWGLTEGDGVSLLRNEDGESLIRVAAGAWESTNRVLGVWAIEVVRGEVLATAHSDGCMLWGKTWLPIRRIGFHAQVSTLCTSPGTWNLVLAGRRPESQVVVYDCETQVSVNVPTLKIHEHRQHDVGLDGDIVMNVDARAGHLVLRNWRTSSVSYIPPNDNIDFFRVEHGDFIMITRGVFAFGPVAALHAAANKQ